jgi:exopolyphosphatase/guanosine-5'-triphosphate,3'-diphosphate pyrophosphatase
MKLGAIDVGSNAMRVLIGEVTKPVGIWHYSKTAYLRLPVRLGEEVFEKGKISDEKIEKFIEGMRIFKNYLDFYGVLDYRAVATSAMRDSSNAKKIIQRVKKETGITLEVITGKEEAELVYLTFQLIPDLKMNYVLIDVGGGSTEITLFQNNRVHTARSFQIGSVRLLKNKVSITAWEEVVEWLIAEVLPFKPDRIFGSGGTINSVHKVLGKQDKSPVDLSEMKWLQSQLEPLSIDERIYQFKIKPDRADVIGPAMEIYIQLMQTLDLQQIYVPKMGLSDGMMLDLYREKTL